MGGISDFFSSVGEAINPYGSLISGAASLIGGERANQGNIATAREQMEFQREMSNTAHQRQVKDLRKAGLNPILSSRYGGSSSPGGAMAQIKDTLTPAINTGLNQLQTTTTANQTKQATKKLWHETNKAFTESFVAKETAPYDILTKKWQTFIAEHGVDAAKSAAEKLAAETKSAVRDGDMAASQAGVILRWIEKLISSLSPLK